MQSDHTETAAKSGSAAGIGVRVYLRWHRSRCRKPFRSRPGSPPADHNGSPGHRGRKRTGQNEPGVGGSVAKFVWSLAYANAKTEPPVFRSNWGWGRTGVTN